MMDDEWGLDEALFEEVHGSEEVEYSITQALIATNPRKRLHTLQDETPPETNTEKNSRSSNDTYAASGFGELGDYMRRKRAKLQIQNAQINNSLGDGAKTTSIFKGLAIHVRDKTCALAQDT